MDLTAIRNKLIVYKTYEKLPNDLIKEIENCLLTKTKIEDFERILEKVEYGLKK
jgi:hypothetical protein